MALRRTDPDLARGIGLLSSAAIEQVRSEAWPDIRDADELHDFLLGTEIVPLEEARHWIVWSEELMATGRTVLVRWNPGDGSAQRSGYAATEPLDRVRSVFPDLEIEAPTGLPSGIRHRDENSPAEHAIGLIVQEWMEVVGPVTATTLARRIGLPTQIAKEALFALEASGNVLQGHFTPGGLPDTEVEWCDRRLLARSHRLTLANYGVRLNRSPQRTSSASCSVGNM